MAMINRIRKRRTLLLILLGVAMLAFLVPYDAVMAMFGAGQQNAEVGEISGTSVSAIELRERMEVRRGLFRYNDDTRLKSDSWNDIVNARVMNPKYAATGTSVTPEEYNEIMYGDNISSWVKQTFYGNAPDPAKIEQQKRVMSEMKLTNIGNWNAYYNYIVLNRQREKYDALLTKGLYANSLDAKEDYMAKNATRSVEFVAQPLSTAPDSLVSFTDSDLRAYFADHKNEKDFRQKASASFEFVTFDARPSASDSASATTALKELKMNWMKASSDSAFVLQNSDQRFWNPEKYINDETSNEENVLKTTTPVGQIFGPYLKGDKYMIGKVLERGEVEEVQARHILLKEDDNNTIEQLRTRIDSIRTVIKNNDNFAEMAGKFGQDGTNKVGGDLGWFGKGKMVTEFEDVAFSAPIGKIKTVETQFGIHLIEVTDKRTQNESKIATLSETIKPSKETMKEVFNTANEFSIDNNDIEGFRSAAEAQGLKVVEITDQESRNYNVQNLGQASDVVSWTQFPTTKIGDVSGPKLVGDKYAVVLLTGRKKAGIPTFEDVKDRLEEEVLKDKKKTYFAEKLNSASSLEQAAEVIGGEVKPARNLKMSATALPGSQSGVDPIAVGSAFAIQVGSMSAPIIGDNGVYIIAPTDEITGADEKDDYTDEKNTLQTRFKSRGNKIFLAEKEAKNISDNLDQF